jgi:RNA polymerase sigma-70 factor (ECF subfamily)
MSDPDRKLARRAGRGDRAALGELYDRYRSRLFGYIRKTIHDPAIAEEVFQEVWIKVIRGIQSYRPGRATFRAWLFRVASNAAIDRLRRNALRSGEELDAPLADGEGRRVDRVASADAPPEREGEGRMFQQDLVRALRTLRPKQRQAVLLRHQQGLTYPEIAEAMQVAEGTAKTLVHRGVRQLRVELSGWDPAGSDDAR